MMKICLILEGCYPYVFGGVSSWINQYILSKPEHEFILLTIINEKDKGKFVYEIPRNVIKIQEVILSKTDKNTKKPKKVGYSHEFLMEIKNLILSKSINWEIIFKETTNKDWNEKVFFESEEYLEIIEEILKDEFKKNGYKEMFFGMKSMLQTLLNILSIDVPQAEIYHATSAGYAGILGAAIQYRNHRPFVLTEHGIYPREREEELLSCSWLEDDLKKIWIRFFYNMSSAIYQYAARVTSLFEAAKKTQIMLGCNPEKCSVIPNGIKYENYSMIPEKEENGLIDIGAFIRFSSIKDVKTLLYSFYETHNRCQNAQLHLFGSVNDRDYYKECLDLIDLLDIKKCVHIYGQVNTMEYISKVDFTILTSISEGQPLTILESFAAKKPVVCTNVGCCKELIEGNNDRLGKAGICCTPMDKLEIAKAMITLCENKQLREIYGKNGQNRVKEYYTSEKMMNQYFELYERILANWQE